MTYSSFGKLRFSLPLKLTALVVALVTIGIVVMAALGYKHLSDVTVENAKIRIDRAARAAASTMEHATGGQFSVVRGNDNLPAALKLRTDETAAALQYSDFYDALLAEIGGNNQGAANLFVFNGETRGFDRFATTFRKPDGSMPPPMSISEGHPAYASLAASKPFTGEVPVMGRLRLAYLTPVLSSGSTIAGALAVDVGWADDLTVARDRLRTVLLKSAIAVLLLVAGFGIFWMTRAMQPLRNLAQFANKMADSKNQDQVPFIERHDEVGALAQGLGRVSRLQDELAYLAYTDPATGQGNRARFLRDLDAALAKSTAGTPSMMMHIDMVRFARVSAVYGTATGDELLRHAGMTIAMTLGGDANVARTGDKKFAVIMEGAYSEAEVMELGKALATELGKPVAVQDDEVHLDAAIGICLLPDHAQDAEAAMRKADLALRVACAQDTQRCVIFAEDMTDNTAREMLIESGLRYALDEDHLMLHYQPQIEPQSGQVVGLEALARWKHPTEGWVAPSEFITIAERCGLIVEIGERVLDQACAQARAWLDDGLSFGHIAVNVSPIQLWQQDFVSNLKSCLDKHRLDGRYLCVEVTESVFADAQGSDIAAILHDIRDLGIILSLDDFGSGYSSLGYLNKLPFDQLKIDQSFVRNAPGNKQDENLLKGIVALAKGLGMTIVAEGAEEAGEVSFVESLGVGSVQGYYYSRPVPAVGMTRAIEEISKKTDDHRQSAA